MVIYLSLTVLAFEKNGTPISLVKFFTLLILDLYVYVKKYIDLGHFDLKFESKIFFKVKIVM